MAARAKSCTAGRCGPAWRAVCGTGGADAGRPRGHGPGQEIRMVLPAAVQEESAEGR